MKSEPVLRIKGISQVCLVVKDIDKSMEAYTRILGIGPWRVYRYGSPRVKEASYRGQPADYHMHLALADAGGLSIELIQPIDGESVYQYHLDTVGEGLHHLGIVVERLDRAAEQMGEAGFSLVQTYIGHGVSGDGAFGYLNTEGELATVIELIQPPTERYDPDRIYP